MDEWIDDLEPVEKYLFLLLYSRNQEPLRGRTWLQKEMFLIGKNVDKIGKKYGNYLKGPFSEDVDKSVSQFEGSEFVIVGQNYTIYLTQKGLQLAEKVWNKAGEQERNMVQHIKELMNSMSSDELLVFIYGSYPETTENSDIKDKVKQNSKEAAISLVNKGKISVEKGSEISGIPLKDFIVELKKRKIPAYQVSAETDLVVQKSHN